MTVPGQKGIFHPDYPNGKSFKRFMGEVNFTLKVIDVSGSYSV